MRARRIFSLRFIAFSLTPLFLVLLAAESAARVKYFVAHDYDWHYLTTPFPLNARSLSMEQRMPLQVRMALQAPAPPTVTAAPQTSTRPVAPGVPQTSAPAAAAIVRTPPQDVSASTAHATPQRQTVVQPSPERQEVVQAPLERQDAVRASPQGQDAVLAPSRRQDAVQTRTPPAAHATEQPAPQDQMAFLWPTPCVSGMVYSTDRRTMLPRTWDANCFRGDRVTVQKNADEYRIAFLGGSTVQDFQSDEEMMTAQFRQLLPGTPAGKHPVVINAGRSGFGSRLKSRSLLDRFGPLLRSMERATDRPETKHEGGPDYQHRP
jgi:hypothetical protein